MFARFLETMFRTSMNINNIPPTIPVIISSFEAKFTMVIIKMAIAPSKDKLFFIKNPLSETYCTIEIFLHKW